MQLTIAPGSNGILSSIGLGDGPEEQETNNLSRAGMKCDFDVTRQSASKSQMSLLRVHSFIDSSGTWSSAFKSPISSRRNDKVVS